MFERITRREEADLFIAWLAISLAFAIIKIAPYGILRPFQQVTAATALVIFAIALLTVGIGFILHEMAHKFTAMRYGYWAEFHKDNSMLLIAVVVASLVGFVFAAPGATVIYTNPYEGRGLTREENGKISAAGPATNLLLCIPFAALYVLGGGLAASGGSLLAVVGLAGIQINAMIAAFNMLPFGPLDGRKIWDWNTPAFTLLIAASFGLLVASFSYL
ncbi:MULTISPECIES: peptidase M50 [unclassified Methanoregula]|uniref:peptidase M50 n=1 Tax=unclassified Methanoregula TaxID=2649730 RepID=UPI0009D3A01F|nr:MULTISPECIES: peptidase M50 [unclassified Methanoregula]OPX64256.1 MAG: Peptidase family M50 [Methanoregula sp. PtaB.Bin085]OPY33619.1 MAG: Peptidase family M50 [Methanoregula sp. PtaU1.Bin006]